MLTELAPAANVPAERIECAVHGCGVVTFALALERMANAFSRLHELEGGARVIAALRAHPALPGRWSRLAHFVGRLGVQLESFAGRPVSNNRGEIVGASRPPKNFLTERSPACNIRPA